MRRNPQPDLTAISRIDWARLAAYIDGEGCVRVGDQVHKDGPGQRRYSYAQIYVANTDVRLTNWLVSTFGGSVQVRHTGQAGRTRRWKTCFVWVISNQRASEVLQRALPYFIVKREQAELVIAFQATCVRCGVKGTPIAVLEQREVLKSKLRVLNARGPGATAINE